MTLKVALNSLGSATTFPHVANLVGWLDKTLSPTRTTTTDVPLKDAGKKGHLTCALAGASFMFGVSLVLIPIS
jgi:hypothetical protein